MRNTAFFCLLVLVFCGVTSGSSTPTTAERLQDMRIGVWLTSDGAYTIWTASHYFVVSASGDSTATNIYCGSSQVRYTDRGIARKQSLRIRQLRGNPLQLFHDYSMFRENSDDAIEEIPLEIDAGLFKPGTCTIEDGVIYDSVTEQTEDYILLSTCNGDQEKIYNNGRSVYLPAGGGEAWSYRIESW